jgi:hypothetical protein
MADCHPRHCAIDPIKAECVDFCLELILRSATVEEKILILGYRPTTAKAILRAYNNYSINDFEDLMRRLTPQQIEEVRAKFLQMSRSQRNYFRLDRRERQAVIDAIKRLRLDGDE